MKTITILEGSIDQLSEEILKDLEPGGFLSCWADFLSNGCEFLIFKDSLKDLIKDIDENPEEIFASPTTSVWAREMIIEMDKSKIDLILFR